MRREGELLAEVADLQAQLRRGQARSGTASSSGATAPGPPAAASTGTEACGMEQAHRQLFMAAAQQLTKEYTARVEQASLSASAAPLPTYAGAESAPSAALTSTNSRPCCVYPYPACCSLQAECRAGQLEERLAGMESTMEQMQQQGSELRAGLQAAQAQCSQEQAAAASLLATNMRLHETVMQLMEQEQHQRERQGQEDSNKAAQQQFACGAGAQVGGAHPPQAQQHEQLQHRRRLPSAQRQTRAGAAPQAANWRRAQQAAAEPARAASTALAVCRGASMGAAGGQSPSRPPSRPAQQQAPAPSAARAAAVQAALTLSAEHRELHSYCKALATELQRVCSCLAVAAPGKQLALLREHSELQREMREVTAQLEDRVVQMTALRRTGLL